MKEEREVIVCGPDNISAFNSALRQHLPEFYPVIKALHAEGLLSGLRGSKLIINPGFIEVDGTVTVQKTCAQCRRWQIDTVGDGTGAGSCQLNSRPGLLKWPGQTACTRFADKIIESIS